MRLSSLVSITPNSWACFWGRGWRQPCRRLQCAGDRNHVRDVHPIDVIGAENRHDVGPGLFDEIDVLIDGVGRSLVPAFARRSHLRRYGNDELVFQNAADLPTFIEVLQQALAAELRQDVNRVNAGVDEVAQDEIDDAVFAAKRNGRLGAILRQRVKPGSLTAARMIPSTRSSMARLLCQP